MSAQRTAQQRKQKLKFTTLQYPKEDMTHFAMLYFTELQRYTIKRTKDRTFQDIPSNAIILPIPANLQEQYKVNYEGAELGRVVGSAGQTIADALTGRGLDAVSDINLSTIAKGVGAKIIEGIDAGLARGAEKYLGEVFNPHLTTVFKGVDLRNHSYTWRMSPETKQESYTLKKIIDTIRNNMLPPTFDNGIRMGYPNECFIKFYGDQYMLYPIFRCVVTDLQINHAAAGTPAFFAETGLPTQFEMQISLQEVEIVTRNEFVYTQDPAKDPTIKQTSQAVQNKIGGL